MEKGYPREDRRRQTRVDHGQNRTAAGCTDNVIADHTTEKGTRACSPGEHQKRAGQWKGSFRCRPFTLMVVDNPPATSKFKCSWYVVFCPEMRKHAKRALFKLTLKADIQDVSFSCEQNTIKPTRTEGGFSVHNRQKIPKSSCFLASALSLTLKKLRNRSTSSVADMTITFSSGLLGWRRRTNPNRMSVSRLRSCACSVGVFVGSVGVGVSV